MPSIPGDATNANSTSTASTSSAYTSATSPLQSSLAASSSEGSSTAGKVKSRYARFQQTRTYKSFNYVRTHRRGILLGASLLYFAASYSSAVVKARKRDKIHDSTYLYFNIYDGAIVESKSNANLLSNLLFSGGGGTSDEPARIMTIFDVVRTLNWAARDDRIKGIVADFSSLSSPAVQSPYSLGLAQIEEVCDAIEELNRIKAERLGPENWRSVAFTDSFDNQGQYTLATAFNEVYMQPTGEVPLTGLGSQIPFFRRLIDWLGIKVQAEAREKYKSFIAQYTEEKLSGPQTENQMEVLDSLNTMMLQRIANNRFGREMPASAIAQAQAVAATLVDPPPQTLADAPIASVLEEGERVQTPASTTDPASRDATAALAGIEEAVSQAVDDVTPLIPAAASPEAQAALEKVRKMTYDGPFSAREAAENGLITGMSYKSYIMDSIVDPEFGGKEENKFMGFYHYYKVMDKATARSKEPILEVGVVYLMGTIGEAGEFDAASVVKGLRQAGEDDDIGCVVLRIDSGGGGVVDSDSIDQAVRDLREKKGKVVIASFSNSAASGGYLSACHADAIVAHPSTLTGSIGVAALRPAFTPTFTDKLKLTVQSMMTGSDYNDLTKELTGSNLQKYKKHVDETYQDFKDRVVEGREIHSDLINSLAGGRVFTGQMAFDLAQEVEAKREVKDQPGTVRLPHVGDHTISASAQAGGAQLAEGQEMSPFAVVEEPAANGVTSAPPVQLTQAPELGPLGRGIVDGLGGIRDAAALAAEVFLTRSLVGVKLGQPNISDAEAIEQILPGLKYEVTADQKVVLPIDVNLKQFPAEQSFWQMYKEAASKGDSMGDPAARLLHAGKVALSSWILGAAARVLSEEMDSLGLADIRRSVGIGSKARGRAHMRAEAPKWIVN